MVNMHIFHLVWTHKNELNDSMFAINKRSKYKNRMQEKARHI